MEKHSMENTNSVVICGNISTDVETSGPFLKFNVAVNQYSGGQKTTSFFPVEVYGPNLRDDVRNCLVKGHCIHIKGYFNTNAYMDKNGQKQYRDVIVADKISTKTKGSFAYAFIWGILLADPQTRTTQSGKNVTEFRVGASHNVRNNKTNTWTNNPAYMGIYAWEPLGKFVAEKFKKDDGIFVIGELVMHQFTGKDGAKRTVYRVKAFTANFLNDANTQGPAIASAVSSAAFASAAPAAATPAPTAPTAPTYGEYGADEFDAVEEDDLPF